MKHLKTLLTALALALASVQGSNAFSQLISGEEIMITRGNLQGGLNVVHSLFKCSEGTARACGYNGNGQLGDGTTTNRLTPVQVSGLCSFTGITENNNKTNMVVFPNPFSSQTTLRSAEFFANATLTVENCFGQIVMQRKNISGEEITITRGSLQSGFYLFSLTENNKVLYSGKLLITDN